MRACILVASLFTVACANTVDGRRADAADGVDAGLYSDRAAELGPEVPILQDRVAAGDLGMTADLPAPTDAAPPPDGGACRWSAGDPVTLSPEPGEMSNRTLLDLESAEGGAWALTSDDAGGSRAPSGTLERLDALGRRRPGGITRFESLSAERASLVVDEALGHRAFLEESGGVTSGVCAIQLLSASGGGTARRSITLPSGGFSLAGCRDLLSNAQGFTLVSEQIRALWGLSLVQLDREGQTPSQAAPSLYEGFPEVASTRCALGDRSFVMMWPERASRTGPDRLRVRRFDSVGAPLGDVELVRERPTAFGAFVIVPMADGLVAVWEETPDALRSPTIGMRPLEIDGRPRGPAVIVTDPGFYGGALAATSALGDVLVASIVGSGVQRIVVRPFTPSGVSRGDLVTVSLPAGSAQVGGFRIVATPGGALVVYTTDPTSYPNRVVAVPLRCAQ